MRKHLSYANVVATLALFFASSGGALAASHYLINSTKQINPKVLKKLKGSAGKPGPAGPYPVVLASGATETGDWGGGTTAPASHTGWRVVVSFPIPLSAAIGEGHVIYVPGASAPGCSGPGHAERGYLCVYQVANTNAETPHVFNIFNPEKSGAGNGGTGEHGFAIYLQSIGAGEAFLSGSYAVSAP